MLSGIFVTFWWLKVDTLRNSDEAFAFVILSTRKIDAWNQPYKDFGILHTFDKSNVTVVDAAILNADPLPRFQLVMLCFIVFVHVWHLLLW